MLEKLYTIKLPLMIEEKNYIYREILYNVKNILI